MDPLIGSVSPWSHQKHATELVRWLSQERSLLPSLMTRMGPWEATVEGEN